MIISLLATATAGHEINTCLSEETRLESSNAVAVKYLAPSSTAGRRKDMGIAEPHSETSCTGDAWNLPWSEPSCGVETNGVAGWKLLSLNPSQFSQTCFPIFQIKSYQIPKVIPWSYQVTMIIPVKPIKHNHIKPYDPPVTDYYQYPMFIPCISHYQIIWVN